MGKHELLNQHSYMGEAAECANTRPPVFPPRPLVQGVCVGSIRTVPRFAVLASTAITVLSALLPATASAETHSAAPQSAQFHLVTTATDVTFQREHRLPGGDYVASWRLFGGEGGTVAGEQGSTVTVPSVAQLGSAATARV